jgi:ubiquinone/menaquinone biosynthesis C-methylase UbiE
MHRSHKFWNRLAKRYSRLPVKDEEAYQEKLRTILEHMGASDRVLEFGCGTGSTAITLAPNAGRYHAIDYSSQMINIAREKLEAQPVAQLSFECSDFENFSLHPASYDVLLGMNIVHLLPKWREAVAKAAAALKPGGKFISSTACTADMNGLMMRIVPFLGWLGLVPALSRFTLEEYRQALLASDFRIEHEWSPGKNAAVFIVAVKV